MVELKVHLLGQFSVSLGNTSIINFVSNKVRALFAYLITEAQCSHRRELLADFFWCDQSQETSRANLRRALSNLRKCVRDHNADPHYLLISRQDIQFNSESEAWIDIDVLDCLYRQNDVTLENHQGYHQVLDLYQGEFLEGFNLSDNLNFNEWVLVTRERQHRKMATILKRVASFYERQQDFPSGLPFAWRLVELEPWQEDARRQLMRLLARTGRRNEALNQYKFLAEQLNQELDIEPEAQTTALYKLIKEGKQLTAQEPVKNELPSIIRDSIAMQSLPHEVFVGRHEEIMELKKKLEFVLTGRGGLSFIAGEAGSGKSMLIGEFIRQAQTRHSGLFSAVGFCNPFAGIGDPYLPFREILYQLCGNVEQTQRTGLTNQSYLFRLWNIKSEVMKALIHQGDDLVNTLISSQTLLNISASLKNSDPELYSEIVDLVERKSVQPGGVPSQPHIFSQYTAVLKAVARKHPLLLALDDLQWADAGTIGLLFHLSKQIADSPILLIGAYRSEEVSVHQGDDRHPLMSVLSEIRRTHGGITINLDQAEGRDFIADLLASEPNDLDECFHDSLLHHTNGHPLFTVELLRGLQEDGTLARDGKGRWILKKEFLLEKLSPKIEGIIGERINRLPNVLQRVLAAASVEGEVFTAEVIAAVEGLPLSQVINMCSRLLDRQHRLVRAQQIEVDENKTISTYKFRHILFQKYLYDHLDQIERADYHARVGAALEAHVGDEKAPYAVYLARHFHKANQAEKAILYYQMAGEVASSMSGYLEAVSHFEKAMELLLSLPECPQRNQQELFLQLQTGLAYQAIQGYASDSVGRAFQRAWELSQTVENAEMAKRSYQLLNSYYANVAQFELAKEINDLDKQYLDTSSALGNLELYWGDGYLDLCLGKLGSAYGNFTKMLRYYDPEKSRSYVKSIGMEAGVMGNGWASVLAAWVGYPERSLEHIKSSLGIADKWDSAIVKTDALFYSTWAYQELGDYSAASVCLKQGLELAEKHDIFWITSFLKLLFGRELGKVGRYKDALEMINQGLEIFNSVGFLTAKPFFFLGLAEVHCASGSTEEGLKAVREAETFADETGEHRFSSHIQKIKGDLALAIDDQEAEEAYQKSISIASQQKAKMLELEAALALNQLSRKQGNQEQSIAQLQSIYDWFTEGFDNPRLVESRKLLTKTPP